MNAGKILIALLLVVLLGTAADSQTAAVPDGWLTTVHGIAVTKSGRPVPGLTLYFSQVPGYSSGGTNPAPATVITDTAGRFTLNYDSNNAVPLGYLISTYALFLDRRIWNLSFRTSGQPNDEYDLFNRAVTTCDRRWTGNGANAIFTVVVPDPGCLSLMLRGPDGRAITGHLVRLVPDADEAGFSGVITYSGRTDATGHLMIRCAPGLTQFEIAVPGVGFGATGVVNIPPGQTVAPPLPYLAPFGKIIGNVVPSLAQPGASIAIDNRFPNPTWYDAKATILPDGRFSLADVLPGSHPLILSHSGTAEEITVLVAPGQVVKGVSVLGKEAPKPIAASRYVYPNRSEPPHSAYGRVTDTAGNSVPGAIVYAIYTIPDGHGFASRKIFTTATDINGEYVVRDPDPSMLWDASLKILVDKSGFPPALVLATGDPNVSRHPLDGIAVDVVLSLQHTRLTIHALVKNAPAANAAVRLTQEPTHPFSRFLGAPDATSAAVDQLIHPTAMTGATGNAVFEDLAPGLWQVDAIQRPDPLTVQNADQYFDAATEFPYFVSSPEYPHNRRSGIAVQAGHSSTYSLDLISWTRNVAVQSSTPQGALIVGDSLEYQTGLAGETYTLGPSARADATGAASVGIIAPGLWHVIAREHATPVNEFSLDAEPYEEGSAVIAAAPAVDEPRPVMLHTVTKGPGSLRVKLQDQQGTALAGAVALKSNGSYADLEGAGTVNKSGMAVFKNLPSGSYTLTPTVFGQPPLPALGTDLNPLPPDALLKGHSVVLPQTVAVNADSETDVVIRQDFVGYIRGRVLAKLTDPSADFSIYGGFNRGLPASTHINASGEFVSGPYLPGNVSLTILPFLKQGALTVREPPVSKTLFVGAGKITHIGSVPLLLVPFDEARAMEERSGRPLSGTIFLPDGRTPAWGAHAKVFLPDAWEWRSAAKADALGTLAFEWEYSDRQIPQTPPPGSPVAPVVVAYLPGSYGAVVAPYTPGEPVHLVLPSAMSLRGRVTVGSQSVAGLESTFTIQAAYQGKGKLNDLLSLETTAQADGTFELAGLTPGVYRVQAARDGIWLSQTQTVTVTDKDLPDATLDIGVPGAVMVFHVRDASGRPLVSRTVTLVRLAGPLTDLLWPKTLMTDGAGDLRLEGLEAGAQSVLISSSSASRSGKHGDPRTRVLSFVVPPYETGEQAVEKTVIVTRQ